MDVGKVAAQDAGLSEGENTHEVGVESLQGAVAQQEREFRELDYMCPNGTVFICLQSANGPSGPITTYGRYCTLIIRMYSIAQPVMSY